MASSALQPPARSLAEILADSSSGKSRFTGNLIKLYAALIPACLVVSATNGYEGSLLNGLQGVTSWQEKFDFPSGALLGIVSASYPLGAILSTPISAPIADRFGRRWPILIGSVIMIAGAILQAFSNNIGSFLGGRLIVGFGITLALAPAPVLISELVHPAHRSVFTGMYNTSFYVGSILAAWVTYGSTRGLSGTWAWRLPTILQCLPAVFQVVFIWMLDESPRWLCYKDRSEEAFAILVKIHGNGDENDPLVHAEFYEMNLAITLEKQDQTSSWKLFFTTKANRRRFLVITMLAVFGQWSGNGLVAYYLTKILESVGITSQNEKLVLNGVLQVVNYVVAITAAFLTYRVRRRVMFVGGGIAMWATFSALAVCIAVFVEKGSNAAGKGAIAFIFIYYSAYNFCLNPLAYLYPTEILPFRLRASGVSVLVFFNKGALFFNQFVNPIGMDRLSWKYYIVYIAWLVVEVVCFYLFFPETKGLTLENAAHLFEEREGAAALTESKLGDVEGNGQPDKDATTVHQAERAM
ncbi:general substrate transporter [Sarocladium strictum]